MSFNQLFFGVMIGWAIANFVAPFLGGETSSHARDCLALLMAIGILFTRKDLRRVAEDFEESS